MQVWALGRAGTCPWVPEPVGLNPCSALEQMRLRDEDIGTKVTYQGQELYSHVAFANQATHLANEIGNTNGFLLPAVQNHLPEAVKNTLKNAGKKAKTWEEFRKTMTTIPLSDLCEEATDIARCNIFYAEVAALRTCTSRLTLAIAQMALQLQPALTPTPNRLPASQTVPPSTPPPTYSNLLLCSGCAVPLVSEFSRNSAAKGFLDVGFSSCTVPTFNRSPVILKVLKRPKSQVGTKAEVQSRRVQGRGFGW